LGITISPSYVGEPECNGVIERFMRTLSRPAILEIDSAHWNLVRMWESD
jgi:hypothetical protein